MQILTFTQKLLRQRSFFSSLIPLLALFVGLGSAQNAMAQTITTSNYFVDNTPGNINTTFGGTNSTVTPNFAGANLGSFNINNTNDLLFNGGEITFTAPATPSSVTLNLQLYTPSGPTGSPVGGLQTITLAQTSVTGTTYTYSLSNAQRSLISLVPSDGSYDVDASFAVVYRNGRIDDPARTASFTVTGIRTAPTSIGNSNVFINTTGTTTPNTTYGASSGTTPLFQGANLGTYDINTGKLTLNGGNATTFESNGDAVQGARLIYRIIKPVQPGNTTAIIFPLSNIALTQVGLPTTTSGGTSRLFENTTALRNLISGLANSGTGNFNISVSYEADVLRNGAIVITRDDNGGPGYTATFTTTGIPILTNTWQGLVSNDWFTAANWDLNRVPDAITNVVIPDYGVGSRNVAPDIFAGVSFTASNGQVVNNTNSGPALSRNIDMQGSTQAQRSILRLRAGRWQVYGSFKNDFDSYIQDLNTVCEFAGAGNQTISGGTFTAVELSGGGTKNLIGIMRVSASMTFLTNAGLFTTDISAPADSYVELGGRATSAPDGAQLVGETDVTTIPSYIRGFVRTTRFDVRANEVNSSGQPDPRTFGNIGMTLLFTAADPGDVLVTRNTAESYTPLVANSTGTITERYGIRRIFGVRPNFRTGVVATMTFRYLDTELTNLGPTGTGSVSEPNLALFLSTSGGNQFGFLGVDALDQVNNILTKSGVRTFGTFTLGDRTRPLPVSLVAFDAKRIGADALVTWQTASELNNKAFDVQVSTNGKEFRTIGIVAVESPNSISPKSYSYVDVEKNKTGQRYYRLRQVDLDGKETFFTPRVVNFEGKAQEVALSAYPNPFGSADQLHLTLQTAVAGAGQVTVTDMTGRIIISQKVDLTSGNNDVTMNSLSNLKSGLYLVKFVLPSGEMKTLKVMKQ